MRVGIVGSRHGVATEEVERFVDRLAKQHPDAIVVSGRAAGVDRVAEEAAIMCGLEVEVYPADWKNGGKLAGKQRNWQLVSACDVVVAFWDGWSNGTAHSVTAATALGKRVWVYAPPAPVRSQASE